MDRTPIQASYTRNAITQLHRFQCVTHMQEVLDTEPPFWIAVIGQEGEKRGFICSECHRLNPALTSVIIYEYSLQDWPEEKDQKQS